MKKEKKDMLVTGTLLLASMLFTMLVCTMDVAAIGPKGSQIGLSALNQFVFQHIGVNSLWDKAGDVIMAAALLVAATMAIRGFLQLFRRKHILKVDTGILMAGGIYVVCVLCYFIFEKASLNYRPVLVAGVLEASYPSSHVMIVTLIMTTTCLYLRTSCKNTKLLQNICIAVVVLIIITRILSGMHWFTDIIAGLLFASTLTMVYVSVVDYIDDRQLFKKFTSK